MKKLLLLNTFILLTLVFAFEALSSGQSQMEKSPLAFKVLDIKGKEEILNFCTSDYHVTFPMFSKIVVKGEGRADIYRFLTESATDPDFSGEITWNFEKFLLSWDGTVIARFKPKTRPDDPEVISAIEKALSKK